MAPWIYARCRRRRTRVRLTGRRGRSSAELHAVPWTRQRVQRVRSPSPSSAAVSRCAASGIWRLTVSRRLAHLVKDHAAMRLGLIGLGRIGAFHAATLNGLGVVSTLVVYDQDPALVDAVVQRLKPVERAGSVEDLLSSGIDGVVIAAATAA